MDIELKKEYIPLIAIAAISLMLLFLAPTTQMLGEDEAGYFTASESIMKFQFPAFFSNNMPFNTPPLIPLLSALFFYVLGPSLGTAKFLIAVFGVLSLFLIYLVWKKHGWVAGASAALLLFAMPYFSQFSLIYYLEIPIAFFSILIFYLFSNLDSKRKAISTGAMLAISIFTKISAIFFLIVLLLYSIYRYYYKKDKNYLKFSLISIIISVMLISPFVIRNMILYNYPYVEGLNLFFKESSYAPSWLTSAITQTLSPSVDFLSLFGTLPLLIALIGSAYLLITKDENLFLPASMIVIFLLLYYVRNLIGAGIGESRYFVVIFPQVALIGGYFLNKLYESNKKYLVIIVAILIASLYIGVTTAISIHNSQRYPANYIEALNWIKSNTDPKSIIFTAYSGSVKIFAERDDIWTINEFPQLMTTNDPAYIHQTLKKYNVSYILIWRSIVADNYIIPASNLFGAFTYNFVNVVASNETYFNVTYQNQDNMILKLM